MTNRLLLLAAALLFSTGGAAIKATSLTSWQVAAFRSLIAALALLILLPSARRGWSWRALPVGAAYAATMICFVLSNKLTTAANSIFLQCTAPLYLLLAGPWLLREPIRRRDILLIAIVASGMALFFLGSDRAVSTAPDPARGNLIAAASGITWALTIAGLRWWARDSGDSSASLAPIVIGNLLALAVCLPSALPVARSTPADWATLLYLGIFQIGLAYLCMTAGMRTVPAFEASTLMLVEPALNPFWTWLVHGERPSLPAICGGALILSASLIDTWWRSRTAPRSA